MTEVFPDIKLANGVELVRIWREVEVARSQPEAWRDAVNYGKTTAIAAYVAGVACGWNLIRWGGTHPAEEEALALIEKYYPGEIIPAIRDLFVLEEFRKLRVATRIMDYTEGFIRGRKDVPSKAALWVDSANEPAINLYLKRGYQALQAEGKNTVELNVPEEVDGEVVPKDIEAIVMVKDLARKTSND